MSQWLRLLYFIPTLILKIRDAIISETKNSRHNDNRSRIDDWVRNSKGKSDT